MILGVNTQQSHFFPRIFGFPSWMSGSGQDKLQLITISVKIGLSSKAANTYILIILYALDR